MLLCQERCGQWSLRRSGMSLMGPFVAVFHGSRILSPGCPTAGSRSGTVLAAAAGEAMVRRRIVGVGSAFVRRRRAAAAPVVDFSATCKPKKAKAAFGAPYRWN